MIGAVLSVLGMGGVVLGILAWQEGGDAVAELLIVGAVGLGSLAWWLLRRKREAKPTLLDPDLFRSKMFRFGISGQMLQNIALGGAMIALPIFLQMVLEYNAMLDGSLPRPALAHDVRGGGAGREEGGDAASEQDHPGGLRAPFVRHGPADRGRAARRLRLVPLRPAADRRSRTGAAGLPAQQLHAVADHGRAGQRGGGRELGQRLVRALVRPGVRRRDHAGDALDHLHGHGEGQRGALPRPSSSRSPTASTRTRR